MSALGYRNASGGSRSQGAPLGFQQKPSSGGAGGSYDRMQANGTSLRAPPPVCSNGACGIPGSGSNVVGPGANRFARKRIQLNASNTANMQSSRRQPQESWTSPASSASVSSFSNLKPSASSGAPKGLGAQSTFSTDQPSDLAKRVDDLERRLQKLTQVLKKLLHERKSDRRAAQATRDSVDVHWMYGRALRDVHLFDDPRTNTDTAKAASGKRQQKTFSRNVRKYEQDPVAVIETGTWALISKYKSKRDAKSDKYRSRDKDTDSDRDSTGGESVSNASDDAGKSGRSTDFDCWKVHVVIDGEMCALYTHGYEDLFGSLSTYPDEQEGEDADGVDEEDDEQDGRQMEEQGRRGGAAYAEQESVSNMYEALKHETLSHPMAMRSTESSALTKVNVARERPQCPAGYVQYQASPDTQGSHGSRVPHVSEVGGGRKPPGASDIEQFDFMSAVSVPGAIAFVEAVGPLRVNVDAASDRITELNMNAGDQYIDGDGDDGDGDTSSR